MLNYFKKSLPKEKSKEELDEHYDKMDLEKSDFPAMLIAAFLTFAPVILIIFIVFYGILWFIFLR